MSDLYGQHLGYLLTKGLYYPFSFTSVLVLDAALSWYKAFDYIVMSKSH